MHGDEDRMVREFAARVNDARDQASARVAYRHAFNELRSRLTLYPRPESRASAVFESAARTVRLLASRCLPLGLAVAMHLYPLCTLQCVPLPLVSPARFKRALLLRAIRNRSLILANAGSERSQGTDQPLVATQLADGIRVDGTCEYMSLGSVADIVLFRAKLADASGVVLCAADLKADSVRVGEWKFGGRMRLSDTSSVTFVDHRVPLGRYLLVPDDTALTCISDYQRSWFHLFLAEIYLARLEHSRAVWGVPRTTEHIVSLNEAARLREYSLHLLDNYSSSPDVDRLSKTTGALKLRVSLLAQSTASALRSLGDATIADAQELAADIAELGYMKSQPTADAKILRSLGVS